MGGDTDRAGCRLGRVRMLMRGECYCRPEGQHDTQTRQPLQYRPHDGNPRDATCDSIPKRETNATRVPIQLPLQKCQRLDNDRASGFCPVPTYTDPKTVHNLTVTLCFVSWKLLLSRSPSFGNAIRCRQICKKCQPVRAVRTSRKQNKATSAHAPSQSCTRSPVRGTSRIYASRRART
jgi:hypothetical protein